MPCGRPRVSAVSRVNVREWNGSPVTARSLSAHSTGGRGGQRGQPQGAPARQLPRDVEPVDGAQQPGLRSQQAREAEQDQHRQPAARAADLEDGGAHDQRQVGDVDICPHCLREERVAGRDHECGERAGAPPERLAAQQEDSPDQRAPGEQGEGQHRRVAAILPEPGNGDRHGFQQRVGSGGERDLVVRRAPAGHVAAPDQPVQGVVVEEGAAEDQPGEPSDRRRGGRVEQPGWEA